jgi:hypothetical protein
MKVQIHSHRLSRLVAVGLAAGALAAPAAGARPAPVDRTDSNVPVVIEPAPIVQSVNRGFDWDSAAIGAGGAGALVLLLSLGGFTYRSRHEHMRLAR